MKMSFTSWLVGLIVDSGMDIALKVLCRYVDESETAPAHVYLAYHVKAN